MLITLFQRACHSRAGAYGDVWTFIALDADTKLIPSFVVSKRDSYHTKMFMDDLAGCLTNRVQISSDALSTYQDATERAFGTEVDYGQVVKTYAVTPLGNAAQAKRAYGWSHRDGKNDEGERFVTVLEIPPVESALTAVRVSIVADGKKNKK